MLRFALVVSRFNEEYTFGLRQGAISFLREKDIQVSESDIFYVPGAFEMPLISQKLAETGLYQGIICLGCVIKGDTAHFEFISLSSSLGIMQSMLNTDVPISFGILTTYTEEQAYLRSAPDSHNKGREAAAACLETAQLLSQIERLGNV